MCASAICEKDQLLRQAMAQVLNVKDTLVSVTCGVEHDFLELGEGLESLHQACELLVSNAEDAANWILGNSTIEDHIEKTNGLISDRLAGIEQEVAQMVSVTQRSQQILDRLQGGVPEIRKVDKQLWILGSNMAVQSAGNVAARKLFSDYADELKQYSKNIKQVVWTFGSDLVGMDETLRSVRAQVFEELAELQEMGKLSAREIRESTKALRSVLRRSGGEIAAAREAAGSLGEVVSNMVMSIQFNDITRQRLEHVIEGLERGARLSADDLYRELVLQSAHLDEVADLLYDAKGAMASDMERIGEVLRGLTLGKNRKNQGSVFGGVKSAIHSMAGLLPQAARIMSRAVANIQSFIEASDRIGTHLERVSEITGDLNLQAINAIVMSKNIGSGGSALVALSKEVHVLSKESTHVVEQTVQMLVEMAQNTARLVETIDAQSDPSAGQTFDGFEMLSAVDTEHQSLRDQAVASAQRVTDLADDIEHRVGFIAALAKVIDDQKQILDGCAAKLLSWVSTAVLENSAGDNNRDYTMASERLVHKKVLGGQATPKDTVLLDSSDRVDGEYGDFELF